MSKIDYDKYPMSSKSCAILRTARQHGDLLGDELQLKKAAAMLKVEPRTISRIEHGKVPLAPFGIVAAIAFSHGIDLEDLAHDKWHKTQQEMSNNRMGSAIYHFRNLLTHEQRMVIINQIDVFAKENKLAGAIPDYFAAAGRMVE